MAGGRKRAFLAPVAVAVAALLPQAQAGAVDSRTSASEHAGGVADDTGPKRLRRSLEAVNRPSVGSGRHLQHASHASHASHDSHMSHVSGAGEPSAPGDTSSPVPVLPPTAPPTAPPTTAPPTTLPPTTAPVVVNVKASLDPKQVTPPPKHTKSGASGQFTANFVDNTLTLTWSLSFQHLTGNPVSVRLHDGDPGSNGRVAATLCKNCGNDATGSVVLSPSDADLLRTGHTYVDVTTKKNKKGEIRGQITLAG